MMMAKVASLRYKGLEPSKLMTWPKEEEKPAASFQDVFGVISGVARRNK